MGGLPCARNGGSVAMSDSTMAAQVLRMDHSLMSRHGLNDDFFRLESVRFLGNFWGTRGEDATEMNPSMFFWVNFLWRERT